MCFSTAASLASGAGLAAIGIASLAAVPARREMLFAGIPLLFGVHQLMEGGLWLALHRGDAAMTSCMTAGFSMIAQCAWPIIAPLAVWLVEPPGWRRQAIAACVAAGVLIAAILLYGQATDFAPAEIRDGHIFYGFPHYNWFRDAHLLLPAFALYVIATCAGGLLSSDRLIVLFGAAVTLSLAATAAIFETWLVSVWCFFAALLSAIVFIWAMQRRRLAARAWMLAIPPARTS